MGIWKYARRISWDTVHYNPADLWPEDTQRRVFTGALSAFGHEKWRLNFKCFILLINHVKPFTKWTQSASILIHIWYMWAAVSPFRLWVNTGIRTWSVCGEETCLKMDAGIPEVSLTPWRCWLKTFDNRFGWYLGAAQSESCQQQFDVTNAWSAVEEMRVQFFHAYVKNKCFYGTLCNRHEPGPCQWAVT